MFPVKTLLLFELLFQQMETKRLCQQKALSFAIHLIEASNEYRQNCGLLGEDSGLFFSEAGQMGSGIAGLLA